MGSVIGGFNVNNNIPGQAQDALTMSLQLGYSKRDVNRLYRGFRKMDVFRTGSISLRSYCTVNKITTAFGELIFRRMLRLGSDVDRDLTFKEYLLSSWNALSVFDDDSIAALTFQIFDIDDSGLMSVDEVRHMIDVIYRECEKNNLHVLNALIENIGRNPTVSIDEFVILVRNLPSLLYPVFDLVRHVRQRTLGEKRWIEISKLRAQPTNNKHVFMNKMYGTNINVQKFQQLQQQRGKSFTTSTSNMDRGLERGKSSSNMNINSGDPSAPNIRTSFTGNDGSMTGRSNRSTTRDEDCPVNKRRSFVAITDAVPAMMSPLKTNNYMYDQNTGVNNNHSNNNSNNVSPFNGNNNNINNGIGNLSDRSFHNPSPNAPPNTNNNVMKGRTHSMSTIHQRVTYQQSPNSDQQPHGLTRTSSLGTMRREHSPKSNLDAIKIANELHLDRIKKANSQNLNALMKANSTLDAYKRSSQSNIEVTNMDTCRSDNSLSSNNSNNIRNTITPRKSNFKDGFIVGRRYSAM